jgi:hypothetical protein
MKEMCMQTLELSSTVTDKLDFSELICLFAPNANKTDELAPEYKWYTKFPFASKCFQDLSVGDIDISKCNIYSSLLNAYLIGHPKYVTEYRIFSSQVNYKKLTELLDHGEENTISDIGSEVEFKVEVPESSKITWQQAHKLALSALKDAERRRLAFAEEEAERLAIWEEFD